MLPCHGVCTTVMFSCLCMYICTVVTLPCCVCVCVCVCMHHGYGNAGCHIGEHRQCAKMVFSPGLPLTFIIFLNVYRSWSSFSFTMWLIFPLSFWSQIPLCYMLVHLASSFRSWHCAGPAYGEFSPGAQPFLEPLFPSQHSNPAFLF